MEQDIISLIAKAAAALDDPSLVKRGICDDGAILFPSGCDTVWVTDTIVDQVHFDLATCALASVGHKAFAVNLSDIAAMGAKPETALITLVLPTQMKWPQIEQLADGMIAIAKRFGVSVVGGDTNRHEGPLMVGVAIQGKRYSLPDSSWFNSGALAGDSIVVTGALGGSILGKHLAFEPRVELAAYIATNYEIHAATDISDSLTIDLANVLSASKVSARLEMASVPISAAAQELSQQSGKSGLTHALHDGEDFELLLTMDSEQARRLVEDPRATEIAGNELFVIGEIISDPQGRIVSSDGTPIDPAGYQH